MKRSEEASIEYRPDDESHDPRAEARTVLAAAQREWLAQRGVEGVGLGQGPGGADAIVVYVRDRDVALRLPTRYRGWEVVSEVTGDIRPLPE